MKTFQCLVRINKDPQSDWGASVPQPPGCVATGKTIDPTVVGQSAGLSIAAISARTAS